MLLHACGEPRKPNRSFAEFLCAWDTLGTHLRNAYAKYDDGEQAALPEGKP
jgi:hypothetical protein